jgi:hypothetical protein
MPELVGWEVPEKWELAVGSGKVRLVYPYGFMLMVK